MWRYVPPSYYAWLFGRPFRFGCARTNVVFIAFLVFLYFSLSATCLFDSRLCAWRSGLTRCTTTTTTRSSLFFLWNDQLPALRWSLFTRVVRRVRVLLFAGIYFIFFFLKKRLHIYKRHTHGPCGVCPLPQWFQFHSLDPWNLFLLWNSPHRFYPLLRAWGDGLVLLWSKGTSLLHLPLI